MLCYDFEIIYKKGKQNVVIDALSRKEEYTKGLLCVISIPQSDWVEEARIKWKKDQKVCKIIKQLQRTHVHYINLCGRMIHYGIGISYIYVRIPNSNRISFWNCTLLL
jgi:DNA relaxase NicK